MKKLLKKTNRVYKIVNNLAITKHQKHYLEHSMCRGYKNMASIYADLDRDFSQIDLVDLIIYERWLNVRY